MELKIKQNIEKSLKIKNEIWTGVYKVKNINNAFGNILDHILDHMVGEFKVLKVSKRVPSKFSIEQENLIIKLYIDDSQSSSIDIRMYVRGTPLTTMIEFFRLINIDFLFTQSTLAISEYLLILSLLNYYAYISMNDGVVPVGYYDPKMYKFMRELNGHINDKFTAQEKTERLDSQNVKMKTHLMFLIKLNKFIDDLDEFDLALFDKYDLSGLCNNCGCFNINKMQSIVSNMVEIIKRNKINEVVL